MTQKPDIDELRDFAAVAQTSNADSKGNIVLFAGAFTVVFALVLGGMFASQWLGGGTSDVADAPASVVTVSHDFDAALSECAARFDKKHKGDKGLGLGMAIGETVRESGSPLSLIHGLKIKCIGNYRPARLCDPQYRGRFIEVIADYNKSGAMFRMLVGMGNSMQGHRHDRYMPKKRKGAVHDTLLKLFKTGYLQRDDFFSAIMGTPKWVGVMLEGQNIPARPCRSTKA